MQYVLIALKALLFLYIATILQEVFKKKKRFPVYIVFIAFFILAKIAIIQIIGYSNIYSARFNFFSPLYYLGEALLALIIVSAVLSQSESPDKFRRYLWINGSIFFFFFLIAFVVLHLFFEIGVLQISIEYESGGAVKIIRFTEQYKELNKSFVLINLIDFSFTLFWIFNSLHILFHYVFIIISLRGRKTEHSEKNLLLEKSRMILMVMAVVGIIGVIPSKAAFEFSTLGILIALTVIRVRMGSYFKYEHQAYEDNLVRKKAIIRDFRRQMSVRLVKEYMEKLTDVAAEITDASSTGVYRIARDKNLMEPQAFTGPFPPLFPIDETLLRGNRSLSVITHKITATRIPFDTPWLEKASQAGSRQLIEDALHDPEIPQHARRLINLETILTVQFDYQEAPYLLIAANTRDGEPFAQDQLELLTELTG